jgi:hypothetical protein
MLARTSGENVEGTDARNNVERGDYSAEERTTPYKMAGQCGD